MVYNKTTFTFFFPDYVNSAYLSQKIKSNTEKYKDKSYLMSYYPEMQLNVDVGKEKKNGLSLGTELFCRKELTRETEQEPNQVLKYKHLHSSKSHISVNDTK